MQRHGTQFPIKHHSIGDPKFSVDHKETHFNFDWRKLFQTIRKPTQNELETLPIIEIVDLNLYGPKTETFMPNRKTVDETLKKVPMDKWKKILALSPEKVIQKTLEKTTRLSLDIDLDNVTIPKHYFKRRFPCFKHPRLWEEFHTDAIFPETRSAQNRICAKILTVED